MPDGRIPMDIIFGEFAQGSRARGRPHLRFKDVFKRDMKAGDMELKGFEERAQDRNRWRQEVSDFVAVAEKRKDASS